MSTNTPTTIASRLKEIYPDGITQLVPSSNVLVGGKLKFRKDLVQGELVRFDVQLAGEQGFSMGSGEVTLGGAVAQTSAKCEVSGYSIILQSNVSYDAISRAKTSKQAFATFNNSKYIPTAESFRTRQEIIAVYGRQGLGTASAAIAGQVITLTAGSWCSALWMTLKGAVIEAWTAVDGSGSQHNGDLTVGAISIANRTVTVVGTASAVDAADILFLKYQRSVGPYGLMDIAVNAGTLYGISAATYELWKANAYDVGTSALTLGKISLASAMAADKGCAEKLTCLVPNKAFQSLVNDQSALREYGASYSPAKFENGAESIVMHGCTGAIEILPYMFMQEGLSIMFPERFTYLIGSEEMTNQIGQSGDIYFDLESTSSKQMRFFSDWTVFCEKPGYMVRLTRSDALALHT
jgi:hypothetical protein